MEYFEPTLLIIIAGQGILLSLALIGSIFKKKYANFFLGLITSVITIEILTIWAVRLNLTNSPSIFPFWLLGSYLIFPPALWLFVQVNLNPAFLPRKKHLWLFVPALIEIVVESLVYLSNTFSGTNYHVHDNPFWFAFTEVLPVLAMILVVLFFAFQLEKLRKKLKNSPTQQTSKGFTKLYAFLGFFILMTIFWVLEAFYIAPVFRVVEVLLIVFVFVLGHLGYFQPSFLDIPKAAKKEIIERNFPKFDDAKELVRMQNLFEEDKIHTQQKLSLKDVAHLMQLPERYVSGLINLYHGTNFNSFINDYRVKEAIQRIQDPTQQHKNLLGIALESGFSSKSSFNQIFKDTTGKKPSDFLKK